MPTSAGTECCPSFDAGQRQEVSISSPALANLSSIVTHTQMVFLFCCWAFFGDYNNGTFLSVHVSYVWVYVCVIFCFVSVDSFRMYHVFFVHVCERRQRLRDVGMLM